MTAKKAGIGITLDTRSKGDPVKGGAVHHLGKAPLYKSVEASVKKYTQLSRGGSATMTMKCIDPDIAEMVLWKTQRIDLAQRIDKMDYSFAYNDAFVRAVIKQEDWYLFSKYWAPEVHDNFHAENYEDYVSEALRRKAPHKKVSALELLISFLESRWETGRIYCINVTTANYHTPFIDTIKQSNLCMEIFLPTKGYIDIFDLTSPVKSVGETAFCSLSAFNVANISKEEYFAVAERGLRTVHEMILRAPMMTPAMRTSLLERMSVGIGITGLAALMYKNGLDYDGSQDSLDFVEEVAELHYYSLLKASQKMVEDGSAKAVKGIDIDWLPIDTMPSDKVPTLDWEKLRGKPRAHSVLVAHMPTESSAVFSGATNGVYPSRDRIVYKKARKGKVQFISQYFSADKKTAFHVDMVPYYRVIGGFTDQGGSWDYFTDFTTLDNKKIQSKVLVKWFLDQAIARCKSAYYQNFKVDDNEIEQEETCDSGACKL
jgi:ribonucleoside-diphosphate reductase alpha chain